EPVFPAMGQRPLLAVITEPDACHNDERMEATYEAIQNAVSTKQVDLVSVRLDSAHDNSTGVLERASNLTRRLVELSREADAASPMFQVVCSSDLVSVAVEAQAHGIHIKEHHLERGSDIVAQFDYPIIIGTSAHSIQSLPDSKEHTIRPHYYFVGTCYMTASHPEKNAVDLEGPALPGEFKRGLAQQGLSLPVFAIGGIDDTNCDEPVALGADGVAVIRAVLQADNPADMVSWLQEEMALAQADG
ncbi:MAG: hypothetical protein SGILL_010523, partial [Bacillariaceae sp.]